MIALLIGYLVGGLPTADWIAGWFGIDLRAAGSGNPGANNARRLGGARLGVAVLIVEAAKGVSAVVLGGTVAGVQGMVWAGLGAVAGNVINPYRRFRGGQGLGITAGVLGGAWPGMLPSAIAIIAVTALVTRSSPKAALAAVAALLVGGFVWPAAGFPTPWGATGGWISVLGVGTALLLSPKQLINLRRIGGGQTAPR
ncbi:MAG: glycerol-3-phosphate acyltransferase [Gemmatimonadota bacterium]|nr:glycerol-3-phosphate acyltransferase [Gemmatimonadota bacterium]